VRASNLGRSSLIGRPKTLDTPSSCAFLKEPLLFIENNPQSSEYCALCLGKLTPRTLCFPGIDAQSRARLKCINELVNVFLIQK
jgi:hypothetical protein